MTQLQCVRGQRDASGYDYWFEGKDDAGNEVVISGSRMREEGHLLVDQWDTQEWTEWLAIQEPYTPRKPSPRKAVLQSK
jgi:hypothetical protein